MHSCRKNSKVVLSGSIYILLLQISLARLLCDQLEHPPDLRHCQVSHCQAAREVGGEIFFGKVRKFLL